MARRRGRGRRNAGSGRAGRRKVATLLRVPGRRFHPAARRQPQRPRARLWLPARPLPRPRARAAPWRTSRRWRRSARARTASCTRPRTRSRARWWRSRRSAWTRERGGGWSRGAGSGPGRGAGQAPRGPACLRAQGRLWCGAAPLRPVGGPGGWGGRPTPRAPQSWGWCSLRARGARSPRPSSPLCSPGGFVPTRWHVRGSAGSGGRGDSRAPGSCSSPPPSQGDGGRPQHGHPGDLAAQGAEPPQHRQVSGDGVGGALQPLGASSVQASHPSPPRPGCWT